jgi:hypothetical protein
VDLNQIQALPNGAKTQYTALGRVFDLPGWEVIKGRAKAEAEEATQRALCASTWEQFCFNRGQQLAYQQFANFEDSAEAEFAAIAQEVIDQQAAESIEDEVVGME